MARWIVKKDFEGTDFIICSACNCAMNFEYYFEPWHFKYCPYCGEFMDNHGEHEILLDVTNMLVEANECNKENDEEHHNNLVTENDTEIPKYTTEWASSDDCISRQAAIRAICQECAQGGYVECSVDCVEAEVLRKLPPVEPVAKTATPTDEVVDFNNMISAGGRIRNLPPVDPKPVCEDAISKHDLWRIIEDNAYWVTYNETSKEKGMTLTGINQALNECPPVEPKRPKGTETMMVNGEPTEIDPLSYEVGYTHGQFSERPKGEWIQNAPEGQGIDPPYICSICGHAESTRTPFCEQCGADMRGADNEADSVDKHRKERHCYCRRRNHKHRKR